MLNSSIDCQEISSLHHSTCYPLNYLLPILIYYQILLPWALISLDQDQEQRQVTCSWLIYKMSVTPPQLPFRWHSVVAQQPQLQPSRMLQHCQHRNQPPHQHQHYRHRYQPPHQHQHCQHRYQPPQLYRYQ